MHEKLQSIVESLEESTRWKFYTIPSDPIPLARARFTHNHIYDSQKHVKVASGLYLSNIHGGEKLFTEPLALHVIFLMPIPHSKSHTQRKKLDGSPFDRIPDLDNLVKFICDTANGILYSDDRIICDIHAYKIYDVEPRTEFILHEVEQ